MKKPYRKIPGQPLNKEIFNIRLHPDKLMEKQTSVRNYAQEVPEEAGTIEAEKGETIVGNMNNDGMPMFQKIGGKSHAQGGTILNAPDNAYVYSKFNKMKIKNPYILQSFGLDPFTSKTPAQISNKYDFSDSVRGLFDPMSDKLQKKTYEMNIKNSIDKLGKLALVQEGTKGFPQGIPKIAEPYLMSTGISPELFIGNEPEDFNEQGMPMAKRGGQLTRYQTKGNVGDSTDMARAKYLANARGISYDDALRTAQEEKAKGQQAGKKRVVVTKTPTKQTKLVPKVPEQSLGFTNPKAAKEFASKYPTYYSAFLKAYNSNDEEALKNTINLLKNYDVEAEFEKPSTWFSSQGWLPASDQDKFEDLAGQLEEKRDRNQVRRRDNITAQLAETYFTGLQQIKNQALMANNPYLAAEVEGKINKVQKLRPSYKNDPSGWTWYRYEDKRVPVWNGIGEKLFNYVEPDRMYNQEEEQYLLNDVRPYFTNLVKSLNVGQQAPQKGQVQQQKNAAPPTDTMPLTGIEPFDEDTVGYAQFLQSLPKQKLGGSLPKYNGGGAVIKDDGKFRAYEDGSVLNIKTGKYIKQADPNWKPKGKGSDVGKGTDYEKYKEKGKARIPYSPTEAFGKKGITLLNAYRQQFGLDLLPEDASRSDIESAAGELQKHMIKNHPELVADYMKHRNPKPNQKLSNILGQKGYGKKIGGKWHAENTDLEKALKEGKLSDPELAEAYNDNLWWFRALHTKREKLPKEEFEKKMKDPSAIKSGDKLFFPSEESPEKYTEYYTEEEPKEDKKTTTTPPATTIEAKGLAVPPTPEGPVGKWWWQDRVQALADLMDRASIKKYYPQMYDPDLYLAEPTFYDPNRELAQQASIANLGTRAARKMFDPQRFSSIFSNIQGQAAEQAANTLGRYNNLNVGVANQFAQNAANALGAYSRGLASNRTELARQNAILNQQYDNALRQMRARQTANYKQAITNMAKTDVLNSLYPQYAVDPETGGTRPVFLRGRVPLPSEEKTFEQKIKEIQALQAADPTGKLSFPEASKVWSDLHGQVSTGPNQMINPQVYPQSRGWEGYYPNQGQDEEQETAYNYDYWNNQQEPDEYNPYEGYDEGIG